MPQPLDYQTVSNGALRWSICTKHALRSIGASLASISLIVANFLLNGNNAPEPFTGAIVMATIGIGFVVASERYRTEDSSGLLLNVVAFSIGLLAIAFILLAPQLVHCE